MGHAESKAAKITPTASAEVAQHGIPQRFIVTYKKSWTKLSLLISEPDSEPSYVINLAHGAHGDMVLFNGPTMDDAPLANVKYTGKWGADFKIMLPEMEGRPHHEEILRYKANLKTERYWFAMEVGNGSNLHVEKFEWRRSHSEEVKSLGRSKWGWKLVRLGSDTAEPDVPTEEKEDRADGLTSDGKEVVAIWAGAKSTHWMTVGEFEFRNSGATGELGRLWALMAMLTRICIWQKEYQAAQTTATVVAVT